MNRRRAKIALSVVHQAFSEMDINRDGEVSFDEFVRWYSMSSALDGQQRPPPPHSADTTTANSGNVTPTSSAADPGAPLTPSTETALATTDTFATGLAPTTTVTGGGASRLLVDLEKSLLLTDPPHGRAAPADEHPQRSREPLPVGRGSDVGVLTPAAASLGAAAATVEAEAGLAATEAEKDAARERWLAGGTVEGDAGLLQGADSTRGDASAAGDLEKAMELLCVLVKANADADTLIAGLASCIIRNPMGR